MTTMSSEISPGLGASSSSIEADYLTLSVDSVHDLAELVRKGLQLNERQCQDLSSKLVRTVQNIQKLVPPSGLLRVLFGPALKNLYRVLENAKLLVHQCCDTDWCRAAVFQIHNEGTFREVLLEVGLCYNVIYELARGMVRDWVWPLIQALDLRQSSLFLPASESEVREDQETLKKRLDQVAGTSDDRNSYLARYLLVKLECVSAARVNEEFSVPDALLWMNETEPEGTWKLQRVLGSGSGAMCVCRYDWLGIPCARKEFNCRVEDAIFRREAAILAQLNHPNIVKFFCCSKCPEMGKCLIAMELMEMSLDTLIESRGKTRRSFPILLVLDIMTQIARGVCYLHGLNIAHRDLKPQNVVVTESRAAHLEDCFCVKLVDFGMSKTKVQASKSNTISIPGVGTTKYRAPEVSPQAQRDAPGLERKVNWFQADAYSFGITCAVLLSLKEPFEDVPATKLYEELLQGVRPQLPGECPVALVGLLNDCWATNPHSRPGFGEICSRLEQCKLQELLRRCSEGLQGLVGSEYIESVLVKQSHDYSDDHQSIILPAYRPKGFWSSIVPSLPWAFLHIGDIPPSREDEYLRRKVDQKIGESDVEPHIFSYYKLRIATRNFHEDMKLGKTIFGEMYKGVFPNGSVVAVNRTKLFFLQESEFWKEVLLFTKIKHEKLLTLKGFCLHDRNWLVVYEYMENLNVSQILLDKGPSRQMVAWPVRLKICLGVAQGLHYLHALARPRIIHGNITAKTIFLGRNFDLKIGGFFFALSFPDEPNVDLVNRSHSREGTMGYLAPEYIAPEYINNRQLSERVDVYSFGVLCLEIISGRHNFEETLPPDQVYLTHWAWRLQKEDRLLELVDPTLELTDVEVRDVQRMIKLCFMCLEYEAKSRPSMGRIVSILQGGTEWDGQVLRRPEVI